jgi:hypothetical protein
MPGSPIPLLAALFLTAPVASPSYTVANGAHDLSNVVVTVPAKDLDSKGIYAVSGPGGKSLKVQVTEAPLQVNGGGNVITLIVPELKGGASFTTNLVPVSDGKTGPSFHYTDTPGEHLDLLFGDRPVLRYMDAPRNEANHYFTFKPFHHVFDPTEGKTLLTAGAHPNTKEFLYPHHRGLFYGWNKISYEQDGKKVDADIWHGTKNVFSQHDKLLSTEAGPVLGRERSAISWHGPDAKTFAEETREVTAYATTGGTLIDFASVLTTKLPKVRLDGDPQHSGFHFRANQEVAKNGKENTYYLRPDGKGKMGEERNWDPKTKKGPVNIPWDAVSFVVGGKRYTVLRLDHTDNPKESRGSERYYGRIGDYFEYDLTPGKPLKVRYRVWVQEGEMTVAQCEDLSRGFVSPPTVK